MKLTKNIATNSATPLVTPAVIHAVTNTVARIAADTQAHNTQTQTPHLAAVAAGNGPGLGAGRLWARGRERQVDASVLFCRWLGPSQPGWG